METKVKKSVAFLAVVFAVSGLEAQNVAQFRARLAAPDTLYSSTVRVIEQPSAAAVIARMDGIARTDKIRGHRVCVYSDNSQNARANAEKAMAQFRETFPDIPAYLDYETPYFKVKVGNCVSYEEAITLWGRVKGVFPKSIMVDAVISIDELKK